MQQLQNDYFLFSLFGGSCAKNMPPVRQAGCQASHSGTRARTGLFGKSNRTKCPCSGNGKFVLWQVRGTLSSY